MTQEIIYTSAPKGLKAGSRGFCTVVSSEGMARNLAERLESFSGYRHVFGIHDADRELNPVNWAHTTMRIGGRNWHVLSRIADAGQDYSGRSNKLAHHIALDEGEQPPAGPARVLQMAGVISNQWDGHVGIIPQRRLPAVAQPGLADCSAWKELAGDAGWAGVVAEHVSSQRTPASIIFSAECSDTLGLVVGVLDLLPAEQRWNVTFSTYFTQLVPGTECRLRFVLDGTSEASALRNHPHAFVVDLCANLAKASGGKLVDAARSGRVPDSARSTPAGQQRSSASAKPAATSRTENADVGEPEDEIVFASASEVEPNPSSFDSETDDAGTYSLQSDGPDHGGRPKAPPRRSSRGRPAQARSAEESNSRRRNILIISSAVGGMVLLVVVAVVAFQLGGRQPETGADSDEQNGPTNTGSAGSSEQPQFGYTPKSPSRSEPDTSPMTPKKAVTAIVDLVDSGNATGEQGADAVASNAASKTPAKDEPSGDSDSKVGTAKKNDDRREKGGNRDDTTKTKDRPKKSGNGKPETKEREPFASLQRAADDTRELLLPANGKEEQWEIGTTEKISLSLLGGPLLFGGSEGDTDKGFQCQKGDDADIWNVTVRETDAFGNSARTPVGTFKVSPRDGDSQDLTFTWAENRPPISSLFRWTLLRIQAGEATTVCRLAKPEKWDMVKVGRQKDSFVRETEMPLPPSLGPLPDPSRIKLIVKCRNLFPASKHDPADKADLLVIPLLDQEPFDPSRDPYFQLLVNEKLSGDNVNLSLEGHVVAHAYSKESIREIGNSLNSLLNKFTPPSNAPIALDQIRKRLSKEQWSTVDKELLTLQEKANFSYMAAAAKAKAMPDNVGLQDELKVTLQLKEDIDSQIESHKKNDFTKLVEKVQEIEKQIAGATLSLKLSLDVKDGDRTLQVVLAEVDGATE